MRVYIYGMISVISKKTFETANFLVLVDVITVKLCVVVLLIESGVDQNIATHASSTATHFFLVHIFAFLVSSS